MSVKTIELIREGDHLAEVEVDLIGDEGGWSPYVSPRDARKLDEARLALRAGDLAKAAKFGRVFELRPITPSSEAAAE